MFYDPQIEISTVDSSLSLKQDIERLCLLSEEDTISECKFAHFL
jgi:hypothetical protein